MKSYLKSFLKFYSISVISAGYVMAFIGMAFFGMEGTQNLVELMKLSTLVSLIPCIVLASFWALFDYN